MQPPTTRRQGHVRALRRRAGDGVTCRVRCDCDCGHCAAGTMSSSRPPPLPLHAVAARVPPPYLCPCDSLQCEIAPPWLSERHGGRANGRSGRSSLCELVRRVEGALRSNRLRLCVRMCALLLLLSVTARDATASDSSSRNGAAQRRRQREEQWSTCMHTNAITPTRTPDGESTLMCVLQSE